MAATRLELEETLFSDPAFGDKVSRFAMDSSTMVAYVTKERSAVASGDGDGHDGETRRNSRWVGAYTFLRSETVSGPTLVYTLHLPPTPPVSSRLLSTLSLIKKRPTLDATTPIADQLHFVLLSSNNLSTTTTTTTNGHPDSAHEPSQTMESDQVVAPYEGLRSVVHFGVTPWFESYVNAKQGKTVEVTMMMGKKGADAQTGGSSRGRGMCLRG